jgi:hypothetical protein
MCVAHTLHEHVLAGQESGIRMMIPKRVAMATPVLSMSQFLERRSVTFGFQIIDYSSRDYTVNVPLNHTSLLFGICDEMENQA